MSIPEQIRQHTSGPIGRAELNSLLSPPDAGALGVGTTAMEWGTKYERTTVLSVAGVLPAIAGGADLAVGLKVYTFPAGRVLVKSTAMSMAVQQVAGNIDADTPDVGVGTVIATGAVAVLGGTGTFENLVNGLAAADCDGTPTISGGTPTAAVPFLIAAAGAHTVHFNAADGWAAGGDDAAQAIGTIVLNWSHLRFD